MSIFTLYSKDLDEEIAMIAMGSAQQKGIRLRRKFGEEAKEFGKELFFKKTAPTPNGASYPEISLNEWYEAKVFETQNKDLVITNWKSVDSPNKPIHPVTISGSNIGQLAIGNIYNNITIGELFKAISEKMGEEEGKDGVSEFRKQLESILYHPYFSNIASSAIFQFIQDMKLG
ncbi:hypothetical protein [Leptospira saintgironsiae]|uniref:Uncharacterized protein n=1 Tax=Leptospira saintgironsiae TaxID=2023183 RepID=A0A2M9Y7J3_9LEPT|nr:hypothetical protein [Leptospira saintgironsiae]PJZ47534.1 hypothetical protein CH362_18750 [Leptospira saintgironsiae]